jgi:superfamily II DNA or RNA helicase/DNA-binding XRE family transcriptional regulator
MESSVSNRLKALRHRRGLTQADLAKQLSVSFASVSRWENELAAPSRLAVEQIQRMEAEDGATSTEERTMEQGDVPASPVPANPDFSGNSERLRLAVESERLSYGHLFNPAFATETSLIDPLPHQRIAVYEHLLTLPRIRTLLADDAGAGKTIMTGLTVREMLSRRLIRRVMIVAPAGLLGNWERELRTLFSLRFRIIVGGDARASNPFVGPDSNFIIISVDTLLSERVFARLQEATVTPYDFVAFDEAHKLSANREKDLSIRKTDRYLLAESLAGLHSFDPRWSLSWSAQHLLLLTATPHMGRDYPYFCLWRLLEPAVFSTFDAFSSCPAEVRQRYFLRRTKEEMVKLDGSPLYPVRTSDTLSFSLTKGEISEQSLYDRTTAYIQAFYNRARILNRQAAAMAMSVFQRRLASSTYAILRSFERRIAKLDALIGDIQSGKISEDQLKQMQQKANPKDVFEDSTGDEEESVGDREENEVEEDKALGGVVAVSLTELEAERRQLAELRDLAGRVADKGDESKFDKLREIVRDPSFREEKLLIFTEHRDTLDFIARRLEGLGFGGQVARIHGAMDYVKRQEQIEQFRKPASAGGATFMVCTDAAAEGVNLQFCWVMVNYDVPWNPARLEQRMGRIHRYGQKHDKVFILNLVAADTREGRVLKTLLDKLERIRKELGSDKVFDVVGRLFEGVSIKQYMQDALTESGADSSIRAIEGTLTAEQVAALQEKEKSLYGRGGDVRPQLARMRQDLERELYRRVLPGYVRNFVGRAAPHLGLEIVGNLDGYFTLRAAAQASLDPLWTALEEYSPLQRQRMTVVKPQDKDEAIFLHPGEPVFERLRSLVAGKFAEDAARGAVFIDADATSPYMLHFATASVIRRASPELRGLENEELLDTRLVAVKHCLDGAIKTCAAENLLLLRGSSGVPVDAMRFAATAGSSRDRAKDFIVTTISQPMADRHRCEMADALATREQYVLRGFEFQDAELAETRSRLRERAGDGDAKAQKQIDDVRQRQRLLVERRDQATNLLRREPELIVPGEVQMVAHALVVPSSDPADKLQRDTEIERIAMRVARAFEENAGAEVKDVSRPELSRAAGLGDWPGFDLLSVRNRVDDRAIEVKGRADVGNVELSENEWSRACILRERYWLHVVFDCASAAPRLLRVQDPFGRLVTRDRGGVIIEEAEIFRAAEGDPGFSTSAPPKLPPTLAPLFWEHDFQSLNWWDDRDLIASKILAGDDDAATEWLRTKLDDQALARWLVVRGGAGLDPRRLRYWQVVLDLPGNLVDEWVKRLREEPWSKRQT